MRLTDIQKDALEYIKEIGCVGFHRWVTQTRNNAWQCTGMKHPDSVKTVCNHSYSRSTLKSLVRKEQVTCIVDVCNGLEREIYYLK